jgi:GTP-binding protein Era
MTETAKKKATPRKTKKPAARAAKTKAPAKRSVPEAPLTRVGYVALIGRPNVGKSTLLNRIIGQKISIISNKPQTTRISILGIHTTDKGQIIFIDNPGIHKPLHGLNRRMMNFVYASLETADLVCLMIDATEKFGHGDEFVLETMKKVSKPLFLLINKVDIVKKENILLLIDRYKDLLPFKEIIPISAKTGLNVDVYEKLIYEQLPAGPKLYTDEDVTDQSRRFLLAEIIREKILAHVEQELPWVTAVYIDSIEKREPGENHPAEEGGEGKDSEGGFDTGELVIPAGPREKIKKAAPQFIIPKAERRELSRPLTYIKASIFVERDNHRKIIIGRRGQTIKTIGIEARLEIQEILDSRVYLELHVKVRERWRDSPDVLDLIEGQKEM